jgi:hypothetical protein
MSHCSWAEQETSHRQQNHRKQGDNMPHYMVSGYLPDNFDPSTQDEAMIEEIHALNREMIAAGVRKFAGGLGPTKTLRPQPDGKLLVTDGPYLETKEHVGGLWILECADVDEVIAWARKGVKACRFPIEVREIFFMPAPEKN